ncbi:MAG: hypothetical protein WCR46_02340 [Deltaproteobacteria bacterium]
MLKSNDTCSLCQKPATTAVPVQAAFMGRQLQVFAALCQACERRSDRDEVLKAYSKRIFGNSTIQ